MLGIQLSSRLITIKISLSLEEHLRDSSKLTVRNTQLISSKILLRKLTEHLLSMELLPKPLEAYHRSQLQLNSNNSPWD